MHLQYAVPFGVTMSCLSVESVRTKRKALIFEPVTIRVKRAKNCNNETLDRFLGDHYGIKVYDSILLLICD